MNIRKVINKLLLVENKHGSDIGVYITLKVSDDEIQEFDNISITTEALESGLIYCSIGIKEK